MADMAPAAAAMDLGAGEEQLIVLPGRDGVRQRLPEARPAGAAFIFGGRGKERQATARAGEHALALFVEQRARSGLFRVLLPKDRILLGGQPLAPLGIAEHDLELALRRARRADGREEGDPADQTRAARAKHDTPVHLHLRTSSSQDRSGGPMKL